MHKQYKTMRLILGDQLNASHSWYRRKDDSVLYVIAELHQETNYVKHHIQKLVAFFLAMKEFSKALQSANHHVLHLNLNDTQIYQDLPDLITRLCERFKVENFEYQRPDEYRLVRQLANLDFGDSKL